LKVIIDQKSSVSIGEAFIAKHSGADASGFAQAHRRAAEPIGSRWNFRSHGLHISLMVARLMLPFAAPEIQGRQPCSFVKPAFEHDVRPQHSPALCAKMMKTVCVIFSARVFLSTWRSAAGNRPD
jgi:hypothetical protein